MSVLISPLDLQLDEQNPRFVTLDNRNQDAIRKYMLTYEDVCELAKKINLNNGLLLGERIVVINEDSKYIVMEGNRRTCALQLLLERSLIPDAFHHKIAEANTETLDNIKQIDVDVAPDRNYAIALMSRRHIDGVKDWKPLAKKQFFTNMFSNGNSVRQLSDISGVKENDIRNDIKDYKLLISASNDYKTANPSYEEDLISYKIDPFLRIFSSRQLIEPELKVATKDILKIDYDRELNTISRLPDGVFQQIVQLIFKSTIVEKTVTTRNTLFDVPGVKSLLETTMVVDDSENEPTGGDTGSRSTGENIGSGSTGSDIGHGPTDGNTGSGPTDGNTGSGPTGSDTGSGPTGSDTGSGPTGSDTGSGQTGGNTGSGSTGGNAGGPTGGGDVPSSFFGNISWEGKLFPENRDHIGLIVALDELYRMSKNVTRKEFRTVKVYEAYPVGAGMLLRTAYEQALILQIKKTEIRLWEELKQQFRFPMLSNIEDKMRDNMSTVFPDRDMRRAFNLVMSSRSRDFLNANIHNPGLIRTTSASLEGLANGGMLALIQLIIENL